MCIKYTCSWRRQQFCHGKGKKCRLQVIRQFRSVFNRNRGSFKQYRIVAKWRPHASFSSGGVIHSSLIIEIRQVKKENLLPSAQARKTQVKDIKFSRYQHLCPSLMVWSSRIEVNHLGFNARSIPSSKCGFPSQIRIYFFGLILLKTFTHWAGQAVHRERNR